MRGYRLITAAAVGVGLLWAAAQGGQDEPLPFDLPKDAPPVSKQFRQIGWGLGLETNYLVILKPEPQGGEQARGVGPLAVDAEFKKRDVPTPAAWEKVRAELKKRMADYFGTMPPRDLPLDPKTEKEEDDREDHTLKVVSIAFDKQLRGKIGLLVPKGFGGHSALRTPHSALPCILLNDRWGGGIELASKGVYSRAIATHFVREGFIVAVIEHWDEAFGTSSDLCTAGAATHWVMRVVDYLATLGGDEEGNQKSKIKNQRLKIGYWGHVYGADLIPFIASHEDRLACFAASCTCHRYVVHYDAPFWGPPFWARQGDNMGIATRTNPAMYYSRRSVATNPLPFLTQEMMAFVAPRPFLAVNPDSPELFEAIRPVWKLYGKERLLELVSHKWGTNQPVNARDYTVDFFLRTLCGIYPGRAPETAAKAVLDGLRSEDVAAKTAAARLAGWWRLKEATAPLVGLLDSKDAALRRAAAKALHRIGAMKEMIPHLKHPDPIVRLAAVEMMQVFGTEEAFRTLAKDPQDDDRWVNEAKWQTLQVNPWE